MSENNPTKVNYCSSVHSSPSIPREKKYTAGGLALPSRARDICAQINITEKHYRGTGPDIHILYYYLVCRNFT